MFTKYNVTNIDTRMTNAFISKTDCSLVINSFECFLKKKYKRRDTIDAYLKDVKQFIDWYFSNNIGKCFILNKENFNKYEIYLQSVKRYKQNTITYKKVALRKIYRFLIEFNKKNTDEEFFVSRKTNRGQYNHLTQSYIKL